ncbi:MAG: cache domain-containing protein, partial [Pseudomonadota bacterium]
MVQVSEMTGPNGWPLNARIRGRIVAILIGTIVVATVATYFAANQYLERSARADAENQLALYLRSLNEALKQHQHLPYILAQNTDLVAAVEAKRPETLNPMLADFAAAAGLEAIYVMDLAGNVTAASNAGTPQSFLDQNYRFRPYFTQALAGRQSDYFAIGATTGRPGYFVAVPLESVGTGTLGALVIKLDVSELQLAWQARGEVVLAVDEQGITVLAADPAWLYRATKDLNETQRNVIKQERQFGNQSLAPLGWERIGRDAVSVAGERFLLTSEAADFQDWTVHYLTPEAGITQQTLLTTGFAGAIVTVLIGFATFLRSQRIETALEASQQHRHELINANAQLVAAQEELARTTKLAALGQLAASVTHELGQPISALKTHLAAAEIGNEITSPTTAANLRKLAERMEAIS